MIFNWWAGVKYVAGGQCEYNPLVQFYKMLWTRVFEQQTEIFKKIIYGSHSECLSTAFLIGLINSLVDIVMYMYYGLAAVGPSMTKYLWWKRYLTTLQLVCMHLIHIHFTVIIL